MGQETDKSGQKLLLDFRLMKYIIRIKYIS